MIKAKKHFGQNFLKDDTVLSKIIQAIPNNFTNIVEIGPGLGDLTQRLLSVANVISYEIDSDLINLLEDKFSESISNGKFTLVNQDVLKIWKDGSLLSNSYALVANLPYYIATNIILKALDDDNCKVILTMIQKEVALKFCAKPGDKDYSSLSVLASLRGKTEILFDVPNTAFTPQPKVTSSVIRIEKSNFFNEENSIFKNLSEYDSFKKFLSVAFCSPRKTLIKNLSNAYNKEFLIDIYKDLNIELLIRPHELNVALFIEIYKLIRARNAKQY